MRQLENPSGVLGHIPATLPARRAPAYRLARRLGAAGLAAILTPGLGACDQIRLETPPVSEPTPDAVELVRRTAADDAYRIAELSTALAATEVPEEVRGQLARIAADSEAHLASLGGIYDSGLADFLPAPEAPPVETTGSPTPEVEPVETIGVPEVAETTGIPGLVTSLYDAASRNFAAADADENGNLARLLASIGVNQVLAAGRLATAAGLEPTDPLLHFFGTGDEIYLGEQVGGEATGITVGGFQAIVMSEDAARYAFEVTAARNSGDLRTALRQRARVHAARAAAWAEMGQLAHTDQDPRLVAYQIPEGLSPAELVLFIEKGLSVRWASLIAEAAPGARDWLIENLLASQLQVVLWGGSTDTFPGMPEIGEQFGGAPLEPDAPRIPYEWAAELPEEAPSGPVE